MTAETSETPEPGRWVQSVDDFEAEASWLSGVDRPQLIALRSIAEALDAGSFQAALISQFTLIHRGLIARKPGEKSGGSGGVAAYDTAMDFGVWKADA